MGCHIHTNEWKPDKQESCNQPSYSFNMKANTFKEKNSILWQQYDLKRNTKNIPVLRDRGPGHLLQYSRQATAMKY